LQIGRVNSIQLSDYTYLLPDERIAYHPKTARDQSKLLYYHSGKIAHHVFQEIPELLPSNSLLYFNDTRVIPARLHFQKQSGANIEIFLLEPVQPYTLYQLAITAKSPCQWKCSIGNLKRWKDDQVLQIVLAHELQLTAKLINRKNGIVEFIWNSDQLTFSDILELTGKVPLPPYINREVRTEDKERYQTVYSKEHGAVAAPTAGLHFTDEVLQKISANGIQKEFLTLHVSAGTFQPVKAANVFEHEMHHEQIIIKRSNIEALLQADKKVVAVGTTAMRTLESIYWWAVKLKNNPKESFNIEKLFPYENGLPNISRTEAAQFILDYFDQHKIDSITGETSIFIFPGYTFRICDGLITNFHQPGSTLILLVAAFVGEDWRNIYNEALINNYRFLSYGDSSFLIP
jgi:S-adenosylmethionine:tRNA ribosyltransferase-isomerase